MRTINILYVLTAGISLAQGPAQTTVTDGVQSASNASVLARLTDGYGRLPLRFERNQGQTDPRVEFLARGPGYTLFLTGAEAVMRLGEHEVKLRLERANPTPRWQAQQQLPGVSNYLAGNDPAKWRMGVEGFGRVRLAGVYPGIDVVYYGNQRQLEFDVEVAPGADPGRVVLAIPTASGLDTDTAGDLLIRQGSDVIRLHRPIVYQRGAGASASKRRIAASWRLLRGKRAAFRLGPWDQSQPLIIDPVLSYSTYLGGISSDIATGIALDASRNAYITGVTGMTNTFPSSRVGQRSGGGGRDVFIVKLSPAGDALIYSTFLGGNSDDGGTAIAVDPQNNAYVTGWTSSSNFPTMNPLQRAFGSTRTGPTAPSDFGACRFTCDAFVAKLDSNGGLVYSTFLGGTVNDAGAGIAVDPTGRAYVAGWTSSPDFPTARPLQPSLRGNVDVFVARLNAAGNQLDFSSFFGGASTDWANAIALDSLQRVYLTGRTNSTDFPVTPGAAQTAPGGGGDAFIVNLDLGAPGLVYSTYIGGVGSDSGNGIAVGSSGSAFVTGSTFSADFPVRTGGFQPQYPKSPWAKTSDGASTWNAVTKGLPNFSIRALAIDPTDSSMLYAGTAGGLFKSTDAGASWSAVSGALGTQSVLTVVMDPAISSTVYASTSTGLFKSVDGGLTWPPASAGLQAPARSTVFALAIDPTDSKLLYAGTDAGLFISTDGADSWRATPVDDLYQVKSIAVDPFNPATVYATVSEYDFFGDFVKDAVIKSEDSGANWTEGVDNGIRGTGTTVVATDPIRPGVVFLGTASGVFRSTNRAGSWTRALRSDQSWALALAPGAAYAGTASGIYKSVDGGDTWTPVNNGIAMRFINTLVADPRNPSTLLAGGTVSSAAFAVRVSPTGDKFEYSTYLGADGNDVGNAIAVDSDGSAIVAGRTDSAKFPTAGPLQPSIPAGVNGFVARLKSDGSALSFATYLGGAVFDEARAVAVDSSGSMFVAGWTSSADFPRVAPLQQSPGDSQQLGDAFVAKIANQ